MDKIKNVSIIAAMAKNRAIGKDNKLLFRLREDMINFKRLTYGNVVIMGRKTYESIGGSLKGRTNIVLSKTLHSSECKICSSLEEAIECSGNAPIYIIGGGKVYSEAIEKKLAMTIWLTEVDFNVKEADAFFPQINEEEWERSIYKECISGRGRKYIIYKLERII